MSEHNIKNQAKDIITSALFGEKDMQTSIEELTEVLFPGEQLVDFIKNQKVINDVTNTTNKLQEKFSLTLDSITQSKEDKSTFNIVFGFEQIHEFVQEHVKIATVMSKIAESYNVQLNITYTITQNIYPKKLS